MFFRVATVQLLLLLLCVMPPSLQAAEQQETVEKDTSSSSLEKIFVDIPAASLQKVLEDSVFLEFRGKLMTVIAWPFEKVVQPVFGALVYPLNPPFRYVMEHNVIDRSIELITFGAKGNVMLYPTFNVDVGTGSLIGLTYRHRETAPGRTDYLFVTASRYVNNDWFAVGKYSYRKIFGTELQAWGRVRKWWDLDASIYAPRSNESRLYADLSTEYTLGFSHPIPNFKNWSIGWVEGWRNNSFGRPKFDSTLLVHPDSYFFTSLPDRGMYTEPFSSRMHVLQLGFDSKENTYNPTQGNQLQLLWEFNNADPLYDRDTKNHDYKAVRMRWQNFFLLGKKRYKLSRKEIRENQKMLSSFGVKDAVELLNPTRWKERFLERKILVTQFSMRQMWEDEVGGAPFYGLSNIGNSTPLRGYSSRRFRDFAMYGLSFEYRWPIIRLVEGTAFTEYGWTGRSWNSFDWTHVRNSWGFGMRVTKPELFLMRLQFGFHGSRGMRINLTIAPAF